jgi:hypothetical protein
MYWSRKKNSYNYVEDMFVKRKARCVKEINDSGDGLITLDGVEYKAHLREPGLSIEPGRFVTITDFNVEELTAIVTPLDEDTHILS